MQKQFVITLAIAGTLFVSSVSFAQFADSVVSYSPGNGAGVDPQFTNHTSVVLGAPSQTNPFAEATDPFNPAYGTNQILSVNAGGSLTVQFSSPIYNSASHPFGLDFQIFGGTGFIITNEFSLDTFDWVGTPATDGSLFAQNSGSTRVSVSADGVTFYQLNPARAPTVDNLFPTDGLGDFLRPVNPALTAADFAGKDLAGIRSLYDGSGGGTGFDLSWAQDGAGDPVGLTSISFVRVEVLSGKSEIDAFAVVPEPSALTFTLLGGLTFGFARRKTF